MLRGISITLYKRKIQGVDAFNMPICTEIPIEVENVLIEPLSAEEVLSEQQLYGVRSAYRLHIPKGDENDWSNVKVQFFGKTFKTYGAITETIDSMTPLHWNKKVMCERYE